MAIPIYNLDNDLPCISYPFESKHTASKKYLGKKALTGYVYGTLNLVASTDEEVFALHKFWRIHCNYGLEAFIIKMPLFGMDTDDLDYLVEWVGDFTTNKTDTVTNIKAKLRVISPVTFVYTDDGYYITDDNGDYIYSDTAMHKVTNNIITYTDHPDISEIPITITPLLHMPLATDLSMTYGSGTIDFTRESTATYIDTNKVLQYASIDEPRFEKDGLLIEGTGENLNLYSQDFSTGWEVTATSDSSITEDIAISPDGTTTAGEYKCTTTTDTNRRLRVSSNITITDNITYTQSIFVKPIANWRWVTYALSGGTAFTAVLASVSFDLLNGVVGTVYTGDNANITKLTNGWFKITITGSYNGTTEVRGSLMLMDIDENAAHTSVGIVDDGLYVWGAQLEELAFASSYIPTTTSTVIRADDDLLIPMDNNVNPDAATYIMYINLLGLNIGSVHRLHSMLEGGLGSVGKAWHNIDDDGFIRMNDVVDLNIDSSILDNVTIKHKIAFTQDGTTNTIYIDGNYDNSRLTDYWHPTAGSYIHFGGANVSEKYLFGHVRNFSIYKDALNANEMSSL